MVARAGKAPVIAGGEPDSFEPYVKLNKILQPVRVDIHPGLHFAGNNKMHQGETALWLKRFDC